MSETPRLLKRLARGDETMKQNGGERSSALESLE